MGIENREYIRRPPGYDSGGGYVTAGDGTVCKRLIIATVAVFLLQLFLSPQATNWLDLSAGQVVNGQVWRLVTYAFCHAQNNPFHILINMFMLWMFGRELERQYGGREFLVFYLVAAVVAGLAFIALSVVTQRPNPAVGASGSVMAIMMVYAMLWPRRRVYIWGVLPIEIRWILVAFLVYDLWPVVQELAGNGGSDGVAHSAHLGGLAFGFVYKKFDLRLSRIFDGISLPRFNRSRGARRNIRLHDPSRETTQEPLEQQVDKILAKISREGEASLTDRERETLKTASEQYKNR